MKVISLCNYTEIGVYNLYVNNRLPIHAFKESIIAIAFNLDGLRYAIKEINNLKLEPYYNIVHIHFYLSPELYDYHYFILFLISNECHIKFLETTCLPVNRDGLSTNWLNHYDFIKNMRFKKNEIAYINAMVSLKKHKANVPS
ncbi:hypothetical protein [Trabulsiella odontotermitis]|uniref:hypothetical protein n=1 Tax=Trabulsiella odontotermitis TaxID=379893 RepID=UPI000B0A6D79|nr:hypothetical protein [Trabulsiella odontotermitis]